MLPCVRNIQLISALAVIYLPIVCGYSTTFLGSGAASLIRPQQKCNRISGKSMSMRVVDIDSEDAFDKTIKSAGSALVVIDYSTTWCGPCKVIAPKFEELSDKYADAIFLKVKATWCKSKAV